MQVIVLDPTQEIGPRAEQALAPAGVAVLSAGSVHSLAGPLGTAAVDDVLIARIRREEDAVRIAQHLRTAGFGGKTVLMVDHPDYLGVEVRLGLQRAESLHCSPVVLDTLFNRLARARAANAPRRTGTFHGLVGRSKQILDVFARVEKAAAGDASVCIYGESGTGKELIARAIHSISDRRHGPLVTFDCAAVPEGLAESQLFGHVRGAFTGAIENREGVFSQADNGTLFIDELCELSMPLQAKLLRVIQGREFVKVGGTKPIRTNIRLVTATNKDPKQAVDAGAFRADLYYRVAVVMIKVPPLRERREDIPLLVETFVKEFNREHARKVTGVTRGVVDRMMQYDWPGNIRELKNTVEEMVIFTQGKRLLDVSDLPIAIRQQRSPTAPELNLAVGMSMQEIERAAIEATLRSVAYDKQKAAKILGIGLRTLYRKLKEFGL